MGLQAYIKAFGDFINNSLIPIILAIAFLFFMVNMLRYFIIGGGNEESQTKAKSLALWGILAFVFITSIWGIVNIFLVMFDIRSTNPVPVLPQQMTEERVAYRLEEHTPREWGAGQSESALTLNSVLSFFGFGSDENESGGFDNNYENPLQGSNESPGDFGNEGPSGFGDNDIGLTPETGLSDSEPGFSASDPFTDGGWTGESESVAPAPVGNGGPEYEPYIPPGDPYEGTFDDIPLPDRGDVNQAVEFGSNETPVDRGDINHAVEGGSNVTPDDRGDVNHAVEFGANETPIDRGDTNYAVESGGATEQGFFDGIIDSIGNFFSDVGTVISTSIDAVGNWWDLLWAPEPTGYDGDPHGNTFPIIPEQSNTEDRYSEPDPGGQTPGSTGSNMDNGTDGYSVDRYNNDDAGTVQRRGTGTWTESGEYIWVEPGTQNTAPGLDYIEASQKNTP